MDWQACSEVVALRRCGHPFIVRLEQAFQTPHYYALLLELCREPFRGFDGRSRSERRCEPAAVHAECGGPVSRSSDRARLGRLGGEVE